MGHNVQWIRVFDEIMLIVLIFALVPQHLRKTIAKTCHV